MPCVVESGLEAREADSFEYRRAALDRLRDRGLLSEREHRRKLARARSRLAELGARARGRGGGARAGRGGGRGRAAARGGRGARARALRRASTAGPPTVALVRGGGHPGPWRGVLCRVVAKAIVIQATGAGASRGKPRAGARAASHRHPEVGAARRRGGGPRALRAGARSVAAARSSASCLAPYTRYRPGAWLRGPRGARRRAGRARRRRAGPAAPAAPPRAASRFSLGATTPLSAALREALALARVLGAADAQHHLERHHGVPRRLAAERREARVVADLPLALVEARRAEVEDVALGRAQRQRRAGRRPRAGPGRAAAGRAPSSSSSRARCRCASRPCPAARRPRPWFALAARDAFERACSRDAFSALAAFERACCCSLARSPAQQCVRSRRSNSTDARRRARTITANFDK